MKEFSSILSIYPVSEITDINPEPWKNENIGIHFFHAEEFLFDPTSSVSEAGTLYTCDQTFIVTNPSDSELELFAQPVNSILVLRDTSGKKYPVGTRNIPGTANLQRGIQKTRLIFKASCLQNPL